MKTVEMRRIILEHYKGSAFWRQKVDKMPDAQIIAFYGRLKRARKV